MMLLRLLRSDCQSTLSILSLLLELAGDSIDPSEPRSLDVDTSERFCKSFPPRLFRSTDRCTFHRDHQNSRTCLLIKTLYLIP